MTSLIWAFNFRTTFKNIDMHMGLGSYASLKYEPLLYLIKNIICIFYFIIFFIEIKKNKSEEKEENKVLVEKKEGNLIYVMAEENKNDENDVIKQIEKSKNLDGIGKKILFCLKIFFMILFICIIEDAYFICSNNHIIDRVICPIRNFGMLLSLVIFSFILMKKVVFRNKHQIFPIIINSNTHRKYKNYKKRINLMFISANAFFHY